MQLRNSSSKDILNTQLKKIKYYISVNKERDVYKRQAAGCASRLRLCTVCNFDIIVYALQLVKLYILITVSVTGC